MTEQSIPMGELVLSDYRKEVIPPRIISIQVEGNFAKTAQIVISRIQRPVTKYEYSMMKSFAVNRYAMYQDTVKDCERHPQRFCYYLYWKEKELVVRSLTTTFDIDITPLQECGFLDWKDGLLAITDPSDISSTEEVDEEDAFHGCFVFSLIVEDGMSKVIGFLQNAVDRPFTPQEYKEIKNFAELFWSRCEPCPSLPYICYAILEDASFSQPDSITSTMVRYIDQNYQILSMSMRDCLQIKGILQEEDKILFLMVHKFFVSK